MVERKFPHRGLLCETTPSGAVRWRVRVKGQRNRRITLPFGPDHPSFEVAYAAARDGLTVDDINMGWFERTGNVGYQVNQMLRGAKTRAKERSLPCDLTRAEILALLHKQGARCALTGIYFDLRKGSTTRRPWAPSLDRLDNGLGYFLANIRIVCAIANTARSDWPDSVFVKMCMAVAEQHASPSVPRPFIAADSVEIP